MNSLQLMQDYGVNLICVETVMLLSKLSDAEHIDIKLDMGKLV